MCKSKGIKNISKKSAKPRETMGEAGAGSARPSCVYVRLLFNEMTLKGFASIGGGGGWVRGVGTQEYTAS